MWDLIYIDILYNNNNICKAYKCYMDDHIPNYDNNDTKKTHNIIAIPFYKGL